MLQLEVVITARDGGVWAMEAATGLDIDNFPVRTGGKVLAPVTLLKLKVDDSGEAGGDGVPHSNDGLQLIVPCHDGHLYVIAGATGCVNMVDIGEHVYSAVMAEDLSEDGLLELVVGTMNGNLLVFGTDTPYHPLNSQPQFPMGACHHRHACTRPRVCVCGGGVAGFPANVRASGVSSRRQQLRVPPRLPRGVLCWRKPPLP